MTALPPDQPPQYVVKSVSPETEGAATTALVLEIIFGLFAVLGVGHVYGGRTGLGIALMLGWWAFIALASIVSTFTFFILGCLFVPIYIAVPIISGIQARTYLTRREGTGSWESVALVAGGGCLLVIISVVLISLFFAGLISLAGSQ